MTAKSVELYKKQVLVGICPNPTCIRPKIKTEGKYIGSMCPHCNNALFYKRANPGENVHARGNWDRGVWG